MLSLLHLLPWLAFSLLITLLSLFVSLSVFPSIKSLQTYVKNKRGEATIEPKGSDSATVHIDDNTAEKKIEEWNFFHLFRYGFFTTSWLLGMVAFST